MDAWTRRRAALCALCSVLLLGVQAARAEPSAAPQPPDDVVESGPLDADVPFEWSAPEGCPRRAAVLDGLAQLLDADATSWDRFDVVRGNVTPRADAFELELQFILGRRVERRTFATRDCADLAHAAAVALALVLDPAWEWGNQDAAPEPGPTKPAPSEADAAGPASPREPPPPEMHFELGPEGVIDTMTLGRSAFGLGLLSRGRTPLGGVRLSADVFGAWFPGQRIAVRPTESVVLGLASAGVRGCSWPTLVLGLCAEIEAGCLSASGVGNMAGRETFDAWIAPGVSVVLESRLVSGLLLDSRVSLLAPLTRPQYFVNQTEGVHEVPAVAVRVALGLILTKK